jgi:class 3 adenylate cyclase
VTDELERYRGRLVKSTGDDLLATDDGPARDPLHRRDPCDPRDPGLEVCCGFHTGEVELCDADIGGIGVHIGAGRWSRRAGEVLVSRTVADLVTGSGMQFEDRGTHSLKGISGEWQLFAVPR